MVIKSLKTKEIMAKSFLELVAEMPLNKVLVNTVCQRAGINRGVFYYHFQDLDALICWIYHTQITLPTQNLITKDGRDVEKIIDFSLDLLYQNKDFYVQAFQGEHGLGDYAKKEIEERFVRIWQAYLKGRHRKPKQDGYLEKMTTYFSNAHYYTLVSWVQDGMTLPPEEMAQILSTISRDAIRHTLERATEPA